MKISVPNQYEVLEPGHREVVASRDRAYAAIDFALREDGQFSYGIEMHYGQGGFGLPICVHGDAFPTMGAARVAALGELLRRWPGPFISDSARVHHELRELREQVESHLRQPSLF